MYDRSVEFCCTFLEVHEKLISSWWLLGFREAGHCIALLGESVKILLRCLGVSNWHRSCKRRGGRLWSIADSKVCASWLRRVYEEVFQIAQLIAGSVLFGFSH